MEIRVLGLSKGTARKVVWVLDIELELIPESLDRSLNPAAPPSPLMPSSGNPPTAYFTLAILALLSSSLGDISLVSMAPMVFEVPLSKISRELFAISRALSKTSRVCSKNSLVVLFL